MKKKNKLWKEKTKMKEKDKEMVKSQHGSGNKIQQEIKLENLIIDKNNAFGR